MLLRPEWEGLETLFMSPCVCFVRARSCMRAYVCTEAMRAEDLCICSFHAEPKSQVAGTVMWQSLFLCLATTVLMPNGHFFWLVLLSLSLLWVYFSFLHFHFPLKTLHIADS